MLRFPALAMRGLRNLGRSFRDRRTTAEYLRQHSVRKLQIGSGTYNPEAWLNSDLEPKSPRAIRLDATRPFPFPDGCFHFIYSEHMIEHIPYEAGRFMLTECLRVLRPGGVLRIATPRLGFLMDLYTADLSDTQRRYIDWETEIFIPWATAPRAAFVINNFFHAWGHRFIYDEETLREAMSLTGFHDVTLCQLGESRHEALRGLEHEERLPPGLLRLETMVVEGTRPS